MSLIEKAVERLDLLKKAGGGHESSQEASPDPVSAAQIEQRIDAPEQRASVPAPQAEPQPMQQKSPAEVVTIDIGRLSALHMVTPDKPKSGLAEQFRVIKRPLIQNAKGQGAAPIKDGNLIMVTSALPGEGKSFSAINLAISMAMELDFTVLLVDADFSKPAILPRLGIKERKGLMDVLTGDVPDLSGVLLRTNIEKLTILPAGMPHPRATELIASDAMARMLEEIANRYPDRIIVFDSPPLLPTTEARVLATHMGQIVLVVEADRTSHGALRQALTTIENCPVKLMLLNKAASREKTGLYGYGYGYGYSYGSDSKTEAAA